MELHRSRGPLVAAVFFTGGGVLVLTCRSPHSLIGWTAWALIGGGSVLLGLYAFAVTVRRFHFIIGADGLDVRNDGIRRRLPWSQITDLRLEWLKPSASAQNAHPILFATLSTADTGTEHIRLLDLTEVREKPDAVAAALTAYAGGRFTDLRPPAATGPTVHHE